MKKTVLAVLMVVMFVTPCFAQEVEPSEVFSLHGTVWEHTAIITIVFPDPHFPSKESYDLGFYGGKVYNNALSRPESKPFNCYIDLLVASFYVTWHGLSGTSGILLPNGKGISIVTAFIPFIALQILEVNIINDNWTPPEHEPEVELYHLQRLLVHNRFSKGNY